MGVERSCDFGFDPLGIERMPGNKDKERRRRIDCVVDGIGPTVSAGKVVRFDGSAKFEDDLSTVKSRLMWEGGRR